MTIEDIVRAIELVERAVEASRARVRVTPFAPRDTVYGIPDPDNGGGRLIVMHPTIARRIGARDGDWIVRDPFDGSISVRRDSPLDQLERMRRHVVAQAVRRFDIAIAALAVQSEEAGSVWCPTCNMFYPADSAHARAQRGSRS